jgi:RimJ/RimL family protein N-acetyltransferase
MKTQKDIDPWFEWYTEPYWFQFHVDGKRVGQYKLSDIQNVYYGAYALLTNFVILNEYRGRGYGHDMMADILRYAKRMGYPKIKLDVSPNNIPALRVYRKAGFVPDTQGVYDMERILR